VASRLYATTRALYVQVARLLGQLGVGAIGGPTTAALVALYVSGLILLDARPTQVRVARALPGRCHDALNRLLRVTPLSTRALMAGLLRLARHLSRRLGTPGYLCVDDVVIEKPFAKLLPWAAWTYSFAKKRKVYGCHVVLLSWTSDPAGSWRIPVAFRLWRPKRSCAPARYQKKTELVATMLRAVVAAGCPAAYLVGDTAYTGGCVRPTAERLGLVWVGTIAPRTTIVWRGRRQQVQVLAPTLKLKWRPALGVRATALSVYAPSLGQVRLVVLKNEHGNREYLVTNDRTADLSQIVQRKRSRWRIETIFRETKQVAGLGACQSWVDQALVRHVALVFVTFVVLQLLRRDPRETVGAVKARWQDEVLRDGQAPPRPLRAAPLEFRRSRAPLQMNA
jgi:DDE superfamily endonuclease